MRPPALYDTELAGRLAGFDRVNLAAMVERLLGLGLTKGHGAADWSKRPLPSAWLNYAALDVELLIELRAAISRVLAEQGKTDWAAQEFEHLRRSNQGHPQRPPGRTAGDEPRVSTKCMTGGGWPRSANCGQRVTESPSAATSRPADLAGLGHYRCRHRRPKVSRRPCRVTGVRRTQPTSQRGCVVGGTGSRTRKPRSAGDRRTGKRAAAAGAVGQTETGSRRTAGCGARGADGGVATGAGTDREPGLT